MNENVEIGGLAQNQTQFTIDDITTHIIATSYVDRHFVIVTQIKKLGTLISAQTIRSPDGSMKYETSVMLGKRDDLLLQVYARQIIERISKHSNLPLLLAISLHENGRGVNYFETILNSLEEIKTW